MGGGDEALMASNRTFLNERTDLTATEVSPRGHEGTVAQRPI